MKPRKTEDFDLLLTTLAPTCTPDPESFNILANEMLHIHLLIES